MDLIVIAGITLMAMATLCVVLLGLCWRAACREDRKDEDVYDDDFWNMG